MLVIGSDKGSLELMIDVHYECSIEVYYVYTTYICIYVFNYKYKI